VFQDSHGGEGIDVEELLHNIERKDLLENRNSGLDNLETMEKASKELLYEESKGCDKECTILQMVLDLLTLKARNKWCWESKSEGFIPKHGNEKIRRLKEVHERERAKVRRSGNTGFSNKFLLSPWGDPYGVYL
jgi:hypothetical protein